ncbi:MAG: CoA-binding protein, partial [Acidobacteriota bacterium]
MTASLKPILAPRSIALAGVSSRPDSLSIKLLDNLLASGFTGRIYPVNPRASSIRELPCYPSVTAIGAPVDLAVLMVPRDLVIPTVDECLAAGVGGVVVI